MKVRIIIQPSSPNAEKINWTATVENFEWNGTANTVNEAKLAAENAARIMAENYKSAQEYEIEF